MVNKFEKVINEAVVIFPIRDRAVLMAKKTRHIGEGCWNGYGGGMEPRETPIQAAKRELEEEASLTCDSDSFDWVGFIYCHNTKTDGRVFVCKLYIYLVRSFLGEPVASEEMAAPTWFEFDSLPLSEMMLADQEWLPRILSGKKISGWVYYGPFQKVLLRPNDLREVDSL